MRQLQSICLELENLEYIELKDGEFQRFWLDEIYEVIHRVTANNYIGKSKMCRECFLELLPSADHIYDGGDSKLTVFQRLQRRNDITSVVLTYDDGATETVFVPWEGNGCESENQLQTTHLSQCGAMHILIKRGGALSDYIDLAEEDWPDDPVDGSTSDDQA